MKRVDDQHAAVPEWKDLVHCKSKSYGKCRDRKSQDTAVSLYRIKRFLLFIGKYKNFAENIIQNQHNDLNRKLCPYFRDAPETAHKYNAENFQKHGGKTHPHKAAKLPKQSLPSLSPAFKNILFIHRIGKQNGQKNRNKIGKGHIHAKNHAQNSIASKIYKSRTAAKKNIADALVLIHFFNKFSHVTFLTLYSTKTRSGVQYISPKDKMQAFQIRILSCRAKE